MLLIIDKLKLALDRKAELDEATKANNAYIDGLKKDLADKMLAEEVTKVTRLGLTWSLQEKVRYSKKAGNDAEFFQVLRDNELGDLIKETVNANTLNSAMKNLVEENGDELPEAFEDVISVYNYFDISKRKG